MSEKGQSILIVDDSNTNLVLLEAVLEEKGWTIQTARSARQAMKMIQAEKPGLILLDLLMPVVDGQQMLNELKSDNQLKDIPVIMVSAVNDPEISEKCLEKGAAYYMTKPVKIERLIELTEKFLKQ